MASIPSVSTIRRASVFYLKNGNTGGYADMTFMYGAPNLGWKPIANDWTGGGSDTVGLYGPSGSVFYLRDTNTGGMADTRFAYGAGGSGWLPNSRQLQAVDPRAVDRIDLLTVVEHELGHVAGLTDLDSLTDDIMSGVLGAGVRRDASGPDAAFAPA